MNPVDLLEFERRIKLKTAKQIFEDLDSRFYFRIIAKEKPRVDMPKKWYDEIKAKFLQEKVK